MHYTRTTYVEFLYPDTFVGKKRIAAVESRDSSTIRVPHNAYGYRWFDMISAIVVAEHQHVMLTSKRLNVSTVRYYGGELYTLSEMEREFPNEYSYFINVGEVHSRKVLRCRTGNWVIPGHDDVLLGVTRCPR